ncbi:hypothetical protein NDU88_004215 [Pleurodeles waltl]|uniref:Uncharacterized protein n=1 Tax=Pleurodeles waltl TaxID=8319 RepID=A0AAV7QBY3_PLEWA|nr:hypothetical protein NDU88_004215 [Pleurodeles waltl]
MCRTRPSPSATGILLGPAEQAPVLLPVSQAAAPVGQVSPLRVPPTADASARPYAGTSRPAQLIQTYTFVWQPEVEPGQNSAERPEEEQMLGHLQGSTGVEEDGGNRPLRCDPEQEMMKRKEPEADQETTQKAICHGAAYSHNTSGRA